MGLGLRCNLIGCSADTDLRLHPLKGKLAGRYAVNVDENFRVMFAFEAGHAVEVDYGDYH